MRHFLILKKEWGTKLQLWKQTLSTIFIISLTALNGNCKCFDKNQLKSCLPCCCFNKVPLYLLLKPCFCSLLKQQYPALNRCTVPPQNSLQGKCPDQQPCSNPPSLTGTTDGEQHPPINTLTPSCARHLNFYYIVKNQLSGPLVFNSGAGALSLQVSGSELSWPQQLMQPLPKTGPRCSHPWPRQEPISHTTAPSRPFAPEGAGGVARLGLDSNK